MLRKIGCGDCPLELMEWKVEYVWERRVKGYEEEMTQKVEVSRCSRYFSGNDWHFSFFECYLKIAARQWNRRKNNGKKFDAFLIPFPELGFPLNYQLLFEYFGYFELKKKYIYVYILIYRWTFCFESRIHIPGEYFVGVLPLSDSSVWSLIDFTRNRALGDETRWKID